MTIIAWDGTTLAADKLGCNAEYGRAVTKIYKTPEGLVGFAGRGDRLMELLHWFREGRDITKYPEFQTEDDNLGAMFIDKESRIWQYGKGAQPLLIEEPFDAIGSGRDYALALMSVGYSASKAVEITSKLCVSCGKGVDTLILEPVMVPRMVKRWINISHQSGKDATWGYHCSRFYATKAAAKLNSGPACISDEPLEIEIPEDLC